MGLNLFCLMQVSDIAVKNKGVQVKTDNGDEYEADRVLVTVPLAVLR